MIGFIHVLYVGISVFKPPASESHAATKRRHLDPSFNSIVNLTVERSTLQRLTRAAEQTACSGVVFSGLQQG